jgi:hypothetical protein
MTTNKPHRDADRASAIVKSIDRAEMTNVARQALDQPAASVIGDWETRPIGISAGVGTLGIIVTSGTAATSNGQSDWSVVGKVIDFTDSSEMFALTSPHREVNAYTSGLLDSLHGDHNPESRFRAAQCYGLTKVDNEISVLWLEDMSSAPAVPWHDEHFAPVSRHLGHFAATWIAKPPERRDWFHANGYAERFRNHTRNSEAIESNGDDRYVGKLATTRLLDYYAFMRATLLPVVDHLMERQPVLAHIDSMPKNLFPSVTPDGERETVAIDWQVLGYGAPGMDPANLLASSLTWIEMDVDRARRLEPDIIDAYFNGRAAGAALFPVTWIGDDTWRDWMEDGLGHRPEEMTDHWIEVFEWVFPRYRTAVEKAGLA